MSIQPLAGALLAAAALVQCTPAPAISMMKPATGAADVAAPMPAPAASLDKPALEKAIAAMPASARQAPRPDLQRQLDKPAYPWAKVKAGK